MTLPPSTLVLVPGLMCDGAVWAPLLPGLAGRIACQVADHGDCADLQAMARRILAVAPPRFAIAGHSMGGRVALEVCRLAPERVLRLALLDTGFLPRPQGPAGQAEADKRGALLALAQEQGVRAMAAQWVQGMVHPDRLGDAALVDAILDMFARKSAAVFARQIQALLNRLDATGVLRQLAVPTLVQCGRQDAWADVAQHEALAAEIPAGWAVLDIIENAGHMAPMERPEAVAASLLRWLETAS